MTSKYSLKFHPDLNQLVFFFLFKGTLKIKNKPQITDKASINCDLKNQSMA